MVVHVQLLSILRDCLPPGTRGRLADVTLPEGATLSDLIVQLGIDRRLGLDAAGDVVGAGWQVTVGGRFEAEVGRILQEGDKVCLFPPVAGG